ncbi:YjgB family protein [Cohnella rhizosphaerae]|uniref:YjgB family protein n=1 Tax=Cohnella rhizosphaerae TaxID=1457232 RepID=A0A9X4KQX6_9BACL|nr:YjgB family protein [Cohnella rhizosphaerae]MDG0809180.1 YjgB family protein [Cohnella rhizosphaerae]
MKISFKKASYGFALASVLVLAACNSAGVSASSSNGAPSASPSASASAPASPSASAGGGSDAAASPSAGAPAGESAPASAAPTKVSADVAAQIKELLKLAKEGKAPGIPYVAHDSLIDNVRDDWGKADSDDMAGKGFYAVYGKHHAAFGYNKGSQLFDIRSSDAKLQKLTLLQIEQTLGKPSSTAKSGDDTIYVYETGTEFQLKFAIPKSTGKVDHISVFSTTGSRNNMAG